VVVLVLWAGTATAGPRVLLAPVYGEPDVADEAGAVDLLLRASLGAGEPGAIGAPPTQGPRPTLDQAADVLVGADAELLILAQVDRLGPTLVAAAQVIDRTGAVVGRTATQADDGGVTALATALAHDLGATIAVTPVGVPELSLGQLRPFARAEQLIARGKLDDAARELAGADPVISLRVVTARAIARALWTDPHVDAGARLIACSVGGTASDVIGLTGTDASPGARSARALAQVGLSDVAAAELEMKGAPSGPPTALARAAIAQLRQDRAARDAAVVELLAAPGAADRTVLAWLVKLPPGALPVATEIAVLAAAEQVGDRRLAAAIGLRAAEAHVSVERALALISVVELDRTERARLGQALAKLDGPDALRLTAELALAAGDLVGARAALAKLRRATDPRAALFRGRIAWALGDLDTAADELAVANANLELARVRMAAGDGAGAHAAAGDDPRSRIARVAGAEVASREGRVADAVTSLRLAEDLSPGNRDTQVRLASALELAGDRAEADRVRARLATLAEPAGPRIATAAGSGGAGSGSGSDDAILRSGPAATATATRMRASLADMLAGFPAGTLNLHSIVIAPIGPAPSSWAMKELDPAPLVAQLRAVLEDPPFQARVVAVTWSRAPDRPSAAELAGVATASGASGVVLYDVRTDGSLRLVVFDADTQAAFEQHGTIDVSSLLSWNVRWLAIPISIAGVVALLFLFLLVRGSGTLEVKVERDPNGTNEVLCVEVQRTSRRWVIRDLEAFRSVTTAAGAKVGRRTARLVAGTTRFKVPPGHWYVHLYGIYDRPGGTRLLDAQHTVEVNLGRNATEAIVIDLVPRNAELRIKVYDDNPRGVTLWLDDNAARFYTDGKGEVVIYSPLGAHTLHVEAKGIKLDRQFDVATPKVEQVEINLQRERLLADVSGGLTLQKHAVTEAAPMASEASIDLEQLDAEAAAAAAAAADEADEADEDAARPQSIAKLAAAATMPSMVGTPPPLAQGSLVPPSATALLPAGGITPVASRPGAADASVTDLLCGRYRITKMLGRGAMGVVYRARDENLEREVAIKVLASELRHHPDALRFFTEEAKALAQLNHPNIVSVYDQATDGDETYLIMEYVDGRTLESLLEEKGRLPVHTALALIDQLCAGLAYVHARRVIHRDIKPANIFVSRERVVKLGDFGLARVMRELSIRKTEIRGTPLYMAPEQITGENVTHRADLYAVGCTLFELVTGRPPFTDGEILYHHMHTAPPKPSELEPTLSAGFDELVADCIAKEADARIESATAIRERIRTLTAPA